MAEKYRVFQDMVHDVYILMLHFLFFFSYSKKLVLIILQDIHKEFYLFPHILLFPNCLAYAQIMKEFLHYLI